MKKKILLLLSCVLLFWNCDKNNKEEENENKVEDFALSTPADGATNVELLPTFMWFPAENAISYSLLLADNENFTNTSKYDIEGISYKLTTSLDYETTYWWKVIATGEGNNNTNTSLAFSFTTIDEPQIHGDLFKVHDFMSTTDMRTTNAEYMSYDVDNGVWVLSYAGGQSWNGYAVIELHNILDNASKSISDIKGVRYKQKSTGNINQTVTYVRENANYRNFNVNSVVGVEDEDIWTDVSVELDCSNLDNNNDGRRISIGVHTVPNPSGTLYIKDLYFVF
jgi:hypothetical protein